MRVLQVVPSLGSRHGGVSTSVRELCKGLAQLGLEIHLWTTWRAYDPLLDQAEDRELETAGIKLRYFPVPRWIPLANRYAYSPSLMKNLRSYVHQVDIVHIHGVWLYPTLAAARTCRQANIPYLVSPCGALDPTGFRNHRLWKRLYGFWIERKTLMGAARIHFTSKMEENLAYTFGVSRPTVVLPRSIQIEETLNLPVGQFRSQYPEIGHRKILLFLGRLHPIKRLDFLAHVFARVARHDKGVHLVLVGPEDGAGPCVREILRKFNLLDRVTFTGPLAGSNKWATFRDSTLFLLPSEHESFGVSVLEAMAVGIPVLVSPQVALADEIVKAEAGQVIDPDPAAWERTIERLLADPGKAHAMGEAGQRLAAMKFSREKIATAMHTVYAEILMGKRDTVP